MSRQKRPAVAETTEALKEAVAAILAQPSHSRMDRYWLGIYRQKLVALHWEQKRAERETSHE